MDYLGFDRSHRDKLFDGEILFTGMREMEPLPQAVAVAGAMLIVRRPWTEVIDTYHSEQTLEAHADLLGFGRIPDDGASPGSDPYVMAGVRFTPGEQKEISRLLNARAGDVFNLSATEIARLQSVDDDPGAAVALIVSAYREILWGRYTSYRRRGIDGIAPYARKGGERSSPGNEITAAVRSAPLLAAHFPELHAALLGYPEITSPHTEDRFYWVKKTVDKRPCFALVHETLERHDRIAVAAEVEFYVGHTYNSMVTFLGVSPYEGGAVVFAGNRTFTDKVTGLGRSLKKSMGRKIIAQKMAERFERLRDLLEERKPVDR